MKENIILAQEGVEPQELEELLLIGKNYLPIGYKFYAPKGFVFNTDGIYYEKIIGKGEKMSVAQEKICNLIYITRRFVNNEAKNQYVEVCFNFEGQWIYKVFERAVLFNGDRALTSVGIRVNRFNAQKFVQYMNDFEECNHLPLIKLSPVTGWINSIFYPYGSTNLIAGQIDDNGNIITKYHLKGNINTFIEYVKPLLSNKVLRTMFMASCATPFMAELNQRISFIYHVGATTFGKSATQILCASIWGKPEEIVLRLSDTLNSIESNILHNTSIPCFLNERQTIAEKDVKNLDQLVYRLSEGRERGRADNKGNARLLRSFSTIFMMNGENNFLNDEQTGGISTRVVEIDGRPFDTEEMATDIYRFTKTTYGVFGEHLVKEILNHEYEKNINLLKIWQKDLMNQLEDKFKNKKLSNMHFVSFIGAVDILIAFKLLKEGTLDEIKNAAFKVCIFVLEQVADDNNLDNVQKLYEKLIGSFITHSNNFIDISEYRLEKLSYWTMNKPTIFWGHKEKINEEIHYFVVPNVLEDFIKQEGGNLTTFRKEIKKRGLLVCNEAKRLKEKRTGIDVRVYHIVSKQNI